MSVLFPKNGEISEKIANEIKDILDKYRPQLIWAKDEGVDQRIFIYSKINGENKKIDLTEEFGVCVMTKWDN